MASDDLIVTLDRPDIGLIGVKQDGSRRVVEPGRFEAGVWIDTDVSDDLPEVQSLAAEAWTTEVVAAMRALRESQLPSAPSNDPSDYPLSDRQLRLGLVMNGISLSTIDSAIAGISNPLEKATAAIWWDRSTTIHWDHPMTQGLMALVGITPEQASTMWLQAKDLAA